MIGACGWGQIVAAFNGPGLLSPTAGRGMLVQPPQAATVCELDLVPHTHQVIEAGSDPGSQPTCWSTSHEPLNLTLDLEHAHVSGPSM